MDQEGKERLANCQVTGATILDLFACAVTDQDLKEIGQHSKLTELGLGGNQIADLSPLVNLKQLGTLDVRSKAVTHFPELQAIFYSTHHFFLTHRSRYALRDGGGGAPRPTVGQEPAGGIYLHHPEPLCLRARALCSACGPAHEGEGHHHPRRPQHGLDGRNPSHQRAAAPHPPTQLALRGCLERRPEREKMGNEPT